MKSKRSKACDISQKTKNIVWERDKEKCIICHNHSAMPNAHFISRAHGGLGVEQNIVTLCQFCHGQTDNSPNRKDYLLRIETYLKSKYKDWDKEKLFYKK